MTQGTVIITAKAESHDAATVYTDIATKQRREVTTWRNHKLLTDFAMWLKLIIIPSILVHR